MEIPPPEPSKLLQAWMEWERGEATPGRVMANLKTGGLRELLEALAEQGPEGAPPDQAGAKVPGEGSGTSGAPAWKPVV
jgi:hypothetical protein